MRFLLELGITVDKLVDLNLLRKLNIQEWGELSNEINYEYRCEGFEIAPEHKDISSDYTTTCRHNLKIGITSEGSLCRMYDYKHNKGWYDSPFCDMKPVITEYKVDDGKITGIIDIEKTIMSEKNKFMEKFNNSSTLNSLSIIVTVVESLTKNKTTVNNVISRINKVTNTS